MRVHQVIVPDEKMRIARTVLEQLQDWFEVTDAREKYISESAEQVFFAAEDEGKDVGFVYLKSTGKDTVEIACMGVLVPYHRRGIGSALFSAVKAQAKDMGFRFLQVKTVAMGHYEEYDQTNLFYKSLGFKEFEVFPTLWDEHNPCQVYVMAV